MAYDLEEQEQLDEFKAWWALHGKKVVTLVTVLVASYLGYQGWHYYQNQQAMKASTQYENLVKLDITEAKNLKAIQMLSADLMDKYSSTPYAGRAAKGLIHEGKVDQGILNMVEMAFRAYDPCFGCATHAAIGQMPLTVEVFNADKQLLSSVSR